MSVEDLWDFLLEDFKIVNLSVIVDKAGEVEGKRFLQAFWKFRRSTRGTNTSTKQKADYRNTKYSERMY